MSPSQRSIGEASRFASCWACRGWSCCCSGCFPRRWSRRHPRLPIRCSETCSTKAAVAAGYRHLAFDTLGSTNDEALSRARAGDPGKLWIVAGSQSRGRGRVGRSWSSPVGNLYASLLLVDPAEPRFAAELGFVAGLALARAVNRVAGRPDEVRIKWPNDLVRHGAKLAGVLVEGTQLPGGAFACVLGFGVNCASHPSGLPYRGNPHRELRQRHRGHRPRCSRPFRYPSSRCWSLWNGGREFCRHPRRLAEPSAAKRFGADGENRFVDNGWLF